ncbi:MAG: SpoVA/SpoVAEb family sporulation membrane protein [Bacillota bacterium]|nr:SpoVA/SpoVAEb family sporulation membrane protein [Bacillota bacterium]
MGKKTKKPQAPAWYQDIVDRNMPRRPLLRNCLWAFIGGGALCALAEAASQILQQQGLDKESAQSVVLISVIALTALFTGLGLYDKAGQFFGAGLAVPISGFANSVAAAMLEHKSEGFVLGSGCNSFKLAGAVVVFGIASAFVVAVVMLICGG